MNSIILLIVAFVALISAQTPQSGPLTINYLNPGATTNVIFPITTAASSYHVQVYALWIPENATSIAVSYLQTDASCEDLRISISTEGIPCSYEEYYDAVDNTPCTFYSDYEYATTSANSIQFDASDNNGYKWQVESWVYVSIGRDYSGDYEYVCSATLGYSLNTTTVGYVSVYDSNGNNEGAVSVQYTNVNTSSTVAVNSLAVNTYAEYKIQVPTNVAYVAMTVNSSSSNAYLYGRSHAGAGSGSSGYDCYSYDGTAVGSFYIQSVVCHFPATGSFFFGLINSNDVSNNIVTFQMLVCNNGMGGYNCTSPVMPLNILALNASYSFTVPGYGVDGFGYDYPETLAYFDIPANFTAPGPVSLFFNSQGVNQTELYIMWRRDAFVSYEYYDYSNQYDIYTPAGFTLTQFDFSQAGRFWFAFSCQQEQACNFVVSVNSTTSATTGLAPATPTTGKFNTSGKPAATTGQWNTSGKPAVTTGMMMSTGKVGTTAAQVSPASVVVPSVFAAIVAIFALLF